MERMPEQLDPLWAQSGNLEQLPDRRRDLLVQAFQELALAGLDDLLDLLREVLADAGDVGQRRAALHERFDVAAQFADGARGVPVGAHPERVRALDVEQIGDLVEDRLDGSVVAGDGFTPPP